jgi:hypothetical protein
MNELNPPDVVGGLLADEKIDMAALEPIPFGAKQKQSASA